MGTIAEKIEAERISHAVKTPEYHKKKFGQYFTPLSIADYMASLFPVTHEPIKILDPGAGIGTLSCALLNRISVEGWNNPSLNVSAYDIDKDVLEILNQNLKNESLKFDNFSFSVSEDDFLQKTSFEYSFGKGERFSHIIMNPPYKKILTKSAARGYARCFGFETVNLYSAFVGAAIALLQDGGYLVAIIPRSFCNGVYYKPFREFIIKNCSIRHIHLFESRKDAFKDEAVLQENVIVALQKNEKQGKVEISYSSDASFTDLVTMSYDFESIVKPADSEMYINIPFPSKKSASCFFSSDFVSLMETGISVSTGPIVDFRLKNSLKMNPEDNTIPLFYPIHFRNFKTEWPKISKKPNAILSTAETSSMFVPAGYYVVVKRFSTKEEDKRIVASIISAEDVKTTAFAFENHLNVFHIGKKGLPKEIAYGLLVWLNTSFLDNQFRLFSGHTQVNATDLRNLPFPKVQVLRAMGKELQKNNKLTLENFDCIAVEMLNEKSETANF